MIEAHIRAKWFARIFRRGFPRVELQRLIDTHFFSRCDMPFDEEMNQEHLIPFLVCIGFSYQIFSLLSSWLKMFIMPNYGTIL